MISSRKRPLEEAKASAENKKQNVTQPQRRHHGLYNQGATCYLNSVLQVLFMTPEIHGRLDPESQITDRELRNIFEKLKETTCGTEKLTKILEIKDVYQQRDAAECLEMILHKVSPRVSKVFQGELTDKTKCSKGHSIIEETNPFWILPLSLKDAHETTYSVEDGFKRIFESKSFSGNNMVYCNKCKKKTKATSGCEMVKSPQILILLLKRFDFDYNTMSHVKSGCCVDVPCVLETKNKKYKLYGMVNHMGSLRGGHYTATSLSNEDKTWYEFDDDYIKKVKEQPFAKNRTYNSSTAYLLMYRASESLRDEVKEQQNEKGHLERGYQVDHNRRSGERDADDKENRQTQERNERLSHQGRREKGDTKPEKLSSFNEDRIKENSLILKKQNSNYSSKQLPDHGKKAEKTTQWSRKEQDENTPQPRRSSSNIMKNPVLIAVIVLGCVFIVIIVLVTTLSNLS